MAADLLSTLLQFQPGSADVQQKRDYDQQARGFVSQLSSISAAHWQKGGDTPQDVLTVLNPAVNSIAYAFALRQRINAVVDKRSVPDTLKPGGHVWNKLVLWLETFDPVQMRYAGHEWRKLVDLVEQIARATASPGLAIAPMRSAMMRLDPTTGTFTCFHLSFMQLCMETRSYSAAEPILDNYIHSLPCKIPAPAREGLEYSVPCAHVATSGEYMHQGSGHTDKVTLADMQEYYLLGAMAYLGLRQFTKARQFLEYVLVVPTLNVANGVMLEAYKKWVLVSCLADSMDGATPRTANSVAMRQVKAASKAYEAVAEAYTQLDDLPKLKAQIKAGTETWADDGNTGLVKEVLEKQMRSYVSRLSRTFSAIPVSNIASNVGSSAEDVARYLETLITDGHLNASLEQSDKANAGAVLRFFLDPAQGPLAKTEKQQQQALFEQAVRTNILAGQVRDADYRLTLSKEYVENLKRQHKKQGAGGDAMDTAWDDGIEAEEDLMVDLN
ncbi:hypothetical protein BDU57DRAFT_573758 [Ampelomyces quisqualis]|uniref:COP9 signalosome complex subunit 3 n=1 Tax=Ampelomyces quisqualis TaxID=50730 RepID=A0A6A5QNM0_AMPQU|nr:hypothetical protein BDU57DRAFT_573758 [Ampelomyces quisqualis]